MITLQRPGHAWPLLLAANRDERLDRAWDPPSQHWPDRPRVTGGRDRLGGGTWMACNDRGLVAAVLNRTGSLGPAPGKRSRGELPLLAMDFAGDREQGAAAAAAAITRLDGDDYRSFNLVLADRHAVWFVRGTGTARITADRLPAGLHMVTAYDPDDRASARVARHRPLFEAAPAPEPPDWQSWPTLLADTAGPRDAALSVPGAGGFGTVCASLFAVSADGVCAWRFAAGPAGSVTFEPVAMAGAR